VVSKRFGEKCECWILVDASDPVGPLVQSADEILIDVLSTDYHDDHNDNVCPRAR